MSKNVFAYFHELKDVDSRNEKNSKNNTYPEFSEKQFFLKKTAVSLFSKFWSGTSCQVSEKSLSITEDYWIAKFHQNS